MIERGLISFLLADSGVVALVVDRIYPSKATQGAAFPRIILHRISSNSVKSMDGVNALNNVRVQLECWAEDYEAVKGLAQAVKGAVGSGSTRLDGFAGTWGAYTVQSCFVADERDDYFAPAFGDDTGAYRISLDLDIWFIDP